MQPSVPISDEKTVDSLIRDHDQLILEGLGMAVTLEDCGFFQVKPVMLSICARSDLNHHPCN